MSEHLVGPDDVRRVDAEARAGFVRALADEAAGKARKGHREAGEKAVFAIDRRAELLELVAGYRRLKRELGLMDFSDQIELGARFARSSPRWGRSSARSSRWSCSTSTRTPRSPRPRCSPGSSVAATR